MVETNAAYNMNNNTTTINRIQGWLRLLGLVIRILLWPLRRLLQLVFPPSSNDMDGLSSAVTAKAAQAFQSYLRKLSVSSEEWSTTGFAALQTEAVQSSSLILVYLHSPLHRKANDLCQQVLNSEGFRQFLQQPHLLAFGVSIHTAQGAQLAQWLGAASFPLLALLQPTRASSSSTSLSSSLQLVLSVQGPLLHQLRTHELLTYLNAALTRHQVQLAEQEVIRIQREQEAELRREQDLEYQQALEQDQERQRRQQEEEDEQRRIEMHAEQAERNKQMEEERVLQQARSLVQPEPSSGGTRIRFVLPTGARLERRFGSDETIGTLKAYLTLQFRKESNTPQIRNIGLSTNYPKQTFTDDTVTLQDAGLGAQAVLMVQDLDA